MTIHSTPLNKEAGKIDATKGEPNANTRKYLFAGVSKNYRDDDTCREHLFTIRWPHGFICPKCGHTEYYFHTKRKLYQCRQCRHQVSVTAGTVMHGAHTPLVKWFWAIYLASRDKRGISALRLKGELDVCYTTAWTMLHKIRKAMGERDANYRLAGLVEVDGSYFGSPKSGGGRNHRVVSWECR